MNTLLLIMHALAAAVWIGSMFYSLFVFQKKARRHCRSLQEFEDLVVSVSAGARYPVLLALMVMLGSGVGLALPYFRSDQADFQFIILVKVGLFIIASALFAYVSWGLWPKRIFADESELAGIQQKFRIIGSCILATAVIAFVLGVLIR